MKIISRIGVIVVLLILLNNSKTLAQQNFSGTWQINTGKSDFGKAPASTAVKKFEFNIKADSVFIQSVDIDQNGNESKSSSVYILNGPAVVKPTTNNRTMTATMKWSKQTQAITRTGDYSQPGNGEVALKVNETWNLTADGKELTITKSVENVANPESNYAIRAVYDKQ